MAVHHPHLLDFSPPPNTVAAMEPPPPPSSFHHLLALHVDGTTTDMSVGGGGGGGGVVPTHHRVLATTDDDDTAAAWPQQAAVSLSLQYNYNNAPAGGSSPLPLFGGHHQQQQFAAVPSLLAPTTSSMQQQQQPFQLRSSKYLFPVQELLSEFCSLQGDLLNKGALVNGENNKWDDVETSSSSGLWGHPSLSSMDLLELERRKARILSMVEEVDRRYRRYREQMRAVEVSFEAVAGAGAAQVYTRLALRAMSRHFRCLRDALVAQVRALRKAMGERDGGGGASSPAGATKGDTPRLKVLDQCLRQQRAFQQLGTIENYPWRPQRGLPERAVAVLRAWLFEHFLHPYPNDVDKHILARQTGLSRSQVSNWFINARVRLWKPMIEDMYTEEVKQQSDQNPSGGGAVKPEITTAAGNNINPTRTTSIDVTNGGGVDHHHLFSSYPASFHGTSSVSLTLGLQQQQPLFASPMMMPLQQQQRSIMLHGEETGDPAVLMPYRDLTAGSHQFLHEYDLAGSS